MSRHEGVSCDSCLKNNFFGRRYKCLICYDYDLCSECYEEGATSTRHSVDHPMQCILTRSDIDLYFGGEVLNSEQPQSFTCPFCKKMGFSDLTLLEHVSSEHTDTGLEVVCPVCAGLPGGEPNIVTDDFAGHLTLEHRTGPRELISFLDEPSAIRHGGGVRRIPGRTLGGPRSRRSNMHFSSSSGLSALSPSGRESVDPIAELLSQLSGVRRGGPQPSQLQQLQMQIQLERQQVTATRQQLERLPRRNPHPIVSSTNSNTTFADVIGSSSTGSGSAGPIGSILTHQPQSNISVTSINARELNNNNNNNTSALTVSSLSANTNTGLQHNGTANSDGPSQSLLIKFMSPILKDEELAQLEKDRADRSQYVQALMLSTLSSIKIDPEYDDKQRRGESQETNSDNVNSEMNNESNDESTLRDGDANRCHGGSVEISESVDVGNDFDHGENVNSSVSAVRQVHQQQQTVPDDFVEEYTLQQQSFNSSVCKKKAIGGAGKTSHVPSQNATASTMVLERRGRPPPPPIGGQQNQPQSQQQAKLGREIKTSSTMSASKEIPDSR